MGTVRCSGDRVIMVALIRTTFTKYLCIQLSVSHTGHNNHFNQLHAVFVGTYASRFHIGIQQYHECHYKNVTHV